MKILVIDQCSKSKNYPPSVNTYTRNDLAEYATLEEARTDAETVMKAVDLYDGRQQEYITSAVEKLETRAGDTVDRYFISAGFGLVHEDEQLPPYDVTFNDCSRAEIAERASQLGIEEALLETVIRGYDLVFFALGSDYYHAFDLPTVLEATPTDAWVVCFNHEAVTDAFDSAVSLPARTEQAQDQETIVVALKGKYLQNFADHRSHGAQVSSLNDLETYCMTEYGTQSDLGSYDKK
jgi:hypothetical protein